MRRRKRRIYKSRRRYEYSESFKKFTIFLVLSLILAGALYFLFFNPVNINCGIVIDKKEYTNSIKLKLAYNDKVKWVRISNKAQLPDSMAYNITLRGIRVVSISPCKVYTGKVLSKDTEKIVLDTAELKLGPKVFYFSLDGTKISPSSKSKILVGYSTYKFAINQNGSIGAVLIEKPTIDKIRVGISDNNFKSLNHKEALRFYSLSEKSTKKRRPGNGLQVTSKDINYVIPKDNSLEVAYNNKSIILSLIQSDGTKTSIGNTQGRVFIAPISSNPTEVSSLKRIDSTPRVYYGGFEVFIKDDSMRLINEVDIEQYLRFVVPSEMVPSGGVEGYKVQAVAARTYAISDMLSNRFAKSGFHVDDTQLSQAYNAQGSRTDSDTAIKETQGQIITYDGKIIDAKYYSTSPGVGAPFNEVWYNGKDFLNKNPEPYLTFKDYTGSGIKDLSNEDDATNFFKDWTIKAYDSNAQLFRWKFSMDRKQLNETINKQIAEKFKKPSENLRKKWYFNIYRKALIPSSGIGSIEDIYISKRGRAGNVMEMTIIAETGTYKVSKGSNIRSLIKPKSFEVTPLFGDNIKDPGIIYSDFFVFDKELSGRKIKNITIYGGGFGHGAGISQYGIVGLVTKEKKSYIDVLKIFYEGIKLENLTDVVKNSI